MPTDSPALTLSVPAIVGTSLVDEFTFWTQEYSRTISRSGGYYEASWRIPLDTGVSQDEARERYLADPNLQMSNEERRGNAGLITRWFETPVLMHHVEERAAGTVTWEGVVWEMELTVGGLTRRISMDEVYNAVRADYTDTAGGRHITDWYTEDESIALYGRREMILDERYVSGEEAEAAAQSFLAEHAWPAPEVVAIDTSRPPGLFVQAVGYCVTANFQYVDTTAADGQTGNISEFVSRILTYDCQFLQAGNIETNALQRRRQFDGLRRCWDALEELAEMGDPDNAPWLVAVYNGRRLNYEQADSAPQLYWRGPQQGVTGGTGAINPWLVRPGVLRDLTSTITSARPGAFLEEARDVLVDEVEMSQGRERPVLKPGGFDPLAVLRAKDQYLDWLATEPGYG